jgi:dTDP-4-dehydrorhamnose 3,5-epimerase
MRVEATELDGVLVLYPVVHGDARGFFQETWVEERYRAHGIGPHFVQDNLSRSVRGTIRGLHLQHPDDQGKLVFVPYGEALDVAVDVRVGSPTFGRHTARVLSGENHRQLWIPPGFAHGFAVRSETVVFAYKCTGPYSPTSEIGIAWDDPELLIPWDVAEPLVSGKDRAQPRLSEIDPRRLPRWASR